MRTIYRNFSHQADNGFWTTCTRNVGGDTPITHSCDFRTVLDVNTKVFAPHI